MSSSITLTGGDKTAHILYSETVYHPWTDLNSKKNMKSPSEKSKFTAFLFAFPPLCDSKADIFFQLEYIEIFFFLKEEEEEEDPEGCFVFVSYRCSLEQVCQPGLQVA